VSLSQLGLVLRRTGQLKDAGEAYARALRIQEQALGATHPEVARTLGAQVALANGMGEFARARELGERALAIAERAQPPEGVLTAVIANNLAIALYELNDHAGSQRRFEQALRSYEAALGPDHPEVAKTSTNLANVIGEDGDLTGARVLYERAVAIQERRQGRDHPDVALGLNNLADIYVRIGDYTQARALFERSLAILEKAYGAEHTRVAMALGNLAEVRVRQRAYAAAEPLYVRALRIREASLGPDHPSLVYTLTGLGDLRRERGQLADARAVYERALTTAEKGFGPDHPMLALTLHGLGEILLAQGDAAAAEQQVSRAIDIRVRLLGNDHPVVAESRALQALILARTGRHAAALDAALDAERVAREHMQVTAQALSERHAMTYAERRVSGATIAMSLLDADPRGLAGNAGRAWDAVARSRAAVLEEVASRQRLVVHAEDAESRRLAQALVAARERLAGLLARGAGDPASRSLVERAAADRDQAERALAEHSLRFRSSQQRAQVTLAQAVAALPPRSALVAFVKFERVNVSGRRAPNAATHGYSAFIARADGGAITAIPLGDAKAVETAVAQWRAGITTEIEAGLPTARTERIHRTTGTALRTLVWDPLQTALGSVDEVFVVADGSLHLVNLGALPRSTGGYLIEDRRRLHYLSAERDLIERDTPLGTGMLLVDNPDYNADRRTASTSAASAPARDDCQTLQSVRFDALPETRREADGIAAVWTTSPVTRLTGRAATEAALKRVTTGMRVVHLATHGFFLGAWCQRPVALEAAGSPPAPLLAGLAFAGANGRLQRTTDEEDGILMAEEIATLDLQGVEWAVLSACDTGVGLPRAGEGLFGLRRMFQIAGARTVIATLWPVVDRTAREWMTTAYQERFVDDRPTADAVRDATMGVIAGRRARGETTHPAYWAAFIAVGR
jgi:CHAT domain-containing protein/Tfp pilus assembly protein PilF